MAVLLAVLALGVIGAAAWVLADSQADQRGELRARYAERSRIASSLVDALFRVAFTPQAQEAAERYGGPGPAPTPALDAEAKEGNLAYVVVLDARGQVVGRSSRAPRERLARLAAGPPHVRAAMRGPFGLSDVVEAPTRVVESAVAFGAGGGRRVIVRGTPAAVFETFLAGTLRPLPGNGGQAFVLDGQGRTLGAVADRGRPKPPDRALQRIAGPRAHTGTYTVDGSGKRVFSAADVAGSRWHIVTSVPEAVLYESVRGTSRWLPWLLLALGAMALLAIALLARRLLMSSADLRRANTRLEDSQHRLEDRAAELERSNADLEQFAYAASHDLSEPLRTVAGFSQLLARRYEGQLDADADEIVKYMNDGVDRMQQLIDDLLLYSRVGRAPLSDDEVDLDDVLTQVQAWLAPTIAERGAEISADPLPTVRGEAGQLAQVLQNLLANAIKFTAPGVRPVVHVAAGRSDGAWKVCVSDNGIGVDAGEDVIFRMFGRLHPADAYPGTGIGLALARRIVERHGGRIWVEPGTGGGSTFCFTLPDSVSVREPMPISS